MGQLGVGIQTGLVVDGSAVALTVPTGAAHAVIQVRTNDINWYVGSDPATSAGIIEANGAKLEFMHPDRDQRNVLTALRLIRNGSGAAVVDVQYFD